MGLIVFLIWRTLKLMPRTKPQQIKPESGDSIGWDDVAGVEEAKEELHEVVEFLRDPQALPQARREGAAGASCCTARPAPARRCWPRPSRTESGAKFFAQSAASFVEMFAGLGAARIRRLFREARKASPAIIFIDELDAVGGHARQRHLGREGPDAQPAAGGDGRLRRARRRSS